MRIPWLLLGGLWLLLWGPGLVAAQPGQPTPPEVFQRIVLSTREAAYPLAPQAEVLIDTTGTWQIETLTDAQQKPPFFTHLAPAIQLSPPNATYWLRFTFFATASEATTWALVVPQAGLDQLHLYQPDGQGGFLESQAGVQGTASGQALAARYPAFLLALPPQQNHTLYLQISTSVTQAITPILEPPTQLFAWAQADRTMHAFFGGIMLAMILYNLFLYVSLRYRDYLYYVLYLLLLGTYALFVEGLAQAYLPLQWSAATAQTLLQILAAAMMIGLVQFARSFLQTAQALPQWHRILLWLMIAFGISAAGGLALPATLGLSLQQVLAVCTCGLIFALSVYRQWQGYRAARFFALSFLALFLGVGVSYVLPLFDTLPTTIIAPWNSLGEFFHAYGLYTGASLQMVLLSLALADRINTLRAEKIAAQVHAMQSLQATNELKEAYNQELAREVSTRTRELETARDHAERATRVKSIFLAHMSHEIRTPMNGLLGMAELLAETDLTPDQQQFVQVIRSSGHSLLRLLNDILDFSKVEADELELESRPFSLLHEVEEALHLMATQVGEKPVELVHDIAPETPLDVMGDALRLRQILLNLLSNAIKFTQKGVIRVELGAEPVDAYHYSYHLSVRDTGLGIPAERMNRLFKPFAQLDASTARKYGGTGLGLAISRRLAEAMGGTITVESTVGEGATFHVTFVLPLASETHSAFGPSDLFQNQPVLLLTAHTETRTTLTQLLGQWGLQPLATATVTGARALSATSPPPQVLLAEVDIPGLGDLAEELQRHQPVAFLGMASPSGRAQTPPALFANRPVLYKPIRYRVLWDALQQALAPTPLPLTATHKQPTKVENRGMLTNLRVLVADDNLVNRQLALVLLKQLDLPAEAVSSGRQVLDALQTTPYDLILMDIQMPDVDGLEATRRIRASAGPQPCIVALTAQSLPGDRERCLAAGMDGYLSKPFTQKELFATLRQAKASRDDP